MSPNIDLVRSLYDAFDRRDQAAVAAAMDPEVEFRQTEQLPWGGHYKGFPDGVHQFFSKLLSHVESKVDVERMWEAGNAVIVVGRTRVASGHPASHSMSRSPTYGGFATARS